MSEIADEARRIIQGVGGFKAEMRAKGIHVGFGTPPRCVTCDEAWPCTTENAQPGATGEGS